MIRSQLNNLNRYTAKTVGKPVAQNPDKFKAPKLKTPPPSAPAAPAGGQLDPLRSDSIYESALSNIRTGLGDTEAALNTSEDALGSDYGVKFDRDPEGKATNFRLDYTNPFSKASLLQKTFDQQNKATTNGLASRGQLYSGYHQAKKEENVFNNQQGQNSLLTGFGGAATEIFLRRLEARKAANNDRTGAADDLVGRNIQAGPTPAPVPPNALQRVTQQAGGDLKNVKWTQKGLMMRNPFTGAYDIPVT